MAKQSGKPRESNVIQLRQYGRGGWQDTRGAIYKAIMAGQEFQTGNMSAIRRDSEFQRETQARPDTDELPAEWRETLIMDNADYVVFSYDTPIAWHVPDDGDDGGERWVVPDVKYSATTTRHQRLVLTALIFNKTEPITTLDKA